MIRNEFNGIHRKVFKDLRGYIKTLLFYWDKELDPEWKKLNIIGHIYTRKESLELYSKILKKDLRRLYISYGRIKHNITWHYWGLPKLLKNIKKDC